MVGRGPCPEQPFAHPPCIPMQGGHSCRTSASAADGERADLPMSGLACSLLGSRGRLLNRPQEAAEFADDVVRGFHGAGVARSGKNDEFGR